MKVEYFGHSCFVITTNTGTRILTDPYTGVGYELPKDLRADIVTVSHEHFDHNAKDKVSGDFSVISKLGKTVCGGVVFTGIESNHDEKKGMIRGKNRIYKIEVDGVRFCHLGDLGEPCNALLVKEIGEVDILFVPIGGKYTVDASGAWEYIRAIRPRVAIPMHFCTEDCSLDIASESVFLRDTAYIVAENGYIPALDADETRIVVMKRQVGV